MQKNGSGCPDPTYQQALWGIRREEEVRKREKKYRLYRGDIVTLVFSERPEANKKAVVVKKKMRVYDLCEHHIVLETSTGYKDSFRWQEFFERVEHKGKKMKRGGAVIDQKGIEPNLLHKPGNQNVEK